MANAGNNGYFKSFGRNEPMGTSAEVNENGTSKCCGAILFHFANGNTRCSDCTQLTTRDGEPKGQW